MIKKNMRRMRSPPHMSLIQLFLYITNKVRSKDQNVAKKWQKNREILANQCPLIWYIPWKDHWAENHCLFSKFIGIFCFPPIISGLLAILSPFSWHFQWFWLVNARSAGSTSWNKKGEQTGTQTHTFNLKWWAANR